MTPGERVNELKNLLQLSYDMAERCFGVLQSSDSSVVKKIYTDIEALSCQIDNALKEAIHGSV